MTAGGDCLDVKRMSDVDHDVLRGLIELSRSVSA